MNLHESLFHVTQVPIHLIHVGEEQLPSDKIPKHVMVPDDYLEQDIEKAIQGFDFAYHAYLLPNTGNAFVTPVNWKASLDEWHYVYYPLHFKKRNPKSFCIKEAMNCRNKSICLFCTPLDFPEQSFLTSDDRADS